MALTLSSALFSKYDSIIDIKRVMTSRTWPDFFDACRLKWYPIYPTSPDFQQIIGLVVDFQHDLTFLLEEMWRNRLNSGQFSVLFEGLNYIIHQIRTAREAEEAAFLKRQALVEGLSLLENELSLSTPSNDAEMKLVQEIVSTIVEVQDQVQDQVTTKRRREDDE
jgi:hypothetical protein